MCYKTHLNYRMSVYVENALSSFKLIRLVAVRYPLMPLEEH